MIINDFDDKWFIKDFVDEELLNDIENKWLLKDFEDK